jgi:antirestriction protein ArdC
VRPLIGGPHKNQFHSSFDLVPDAANGRAHGLDRNLTGRFGTRDYAAEELVAELSAAFLCAQLNIQGELKHAESSRRRFTSCTTTPARSLPPPRSPARLRTFFERF